VSFPELNKTTRITFRDIDEVEAHNENFVQVINLYLKNGEEKVQLKAMANGEQLIQQLKTAIAEVNVNTA
jgi:hypothetical protein